MRAVLLAVWLGSAAAIAEEDAAAVLTPLELAEFNRSDCVSIPDGKRLAVATLWITKPNLDEDTLSEDEKAESMTCEVLLALRTARKSLTGEGMCFSPEQVDLVVLTNLSSLSRNQTTMFIDAGLVLKDMGQYQPMNQYVQIIVDAKLRALSDSDANDPEAPVRAVRQGLKEAFHMFAMAPFWMTEYAAVVKTDSTTFIAPRRFDREHGVWEKQQDIFNRLLGPQGVDIVYEHSRRSAVSTGTYAVRPSAKAYTAFAAAMKYASEHGINATTGWGGQYTNKATEKYAASSDDYIRNYLAKNNAGDVHEFERTLDAACHINGAPWCFRGVDTCVGMMAHLIALRDDSGDPMFDSVDTYKDDEDWPFTDQNDWFKFHYKDHMGVKPWGYYSINKMLKGNKGYIKKRYYTREQEHLHTEMLDFWGHYSLYYSDTFDAAPEPFKSVCPTQYSCLYSKLLTIDEKLETEPDGTSHSLEDRNTTASICQPGDAMLNVRGGPFAGDLDKNAAAYFKAAGLSEADSSLEHGVE